MWQQHVKSGLVRKMLPMKCMPALMSAMETNMPAAQQTAALSAQAAPIN
jgi:hypothetical protein